jgi:hypothetical protein
MILTDLDGTIQRRNASCSLRRRALPHGSSYHAHVCKIRELSHDMVRFDEEDDDDDEAEYHEVQTKSKASMDKKCVLEEHVEKDGYGDVTFITMKGSKAILDEDRLERFLAAANITG